MLDVVVDMGGISIESSAPGRRERKASGDTFHLDFGPVLLVCRYGTIICSTISRSRIGILSSLYIADGIPQFPDSRTPTTIPTLTHLLWFHNYSNT